MSGWFQTKADEATTEPSVQDRAIAAKDQAGSFLGEKAQAVTTAASDTAEAAKKMVGEAVGNASETAQSGKDNAVESKGQTAGSLGEKTEAAKKAAVEVAEAAKQKATESAQHVQDRAVESKDQAGGFFGEKTEAAKKAGTDTSDAAKQKANEAAQYVQDRASDAAEYTKAEPPVAAKDTTGNVFQQAGGQVMGAAVGAKDAVMNTLGMGGDAAAEKK